MCVSKQDTRIARQSNEWVIVSPVAAVPPAYANGRRNVSKRAAGRSAYGPALAPVVVPTSGDTDFVVLDLVDQAMFVCNPS